MADDIQFNSHRSPVFARHGMVAASQPLAVGAGLQILEAGGNAADAAVAVAAALNVTEPTSTGLGGDCFALYYDAATSQISALNGSGRAPAALTLECVQQAGISDSLPPLHPYAITVPGACAGWCDLIEKFGRLPMQQILAPAIRLAEEGFPVAPLTARFWQRSAQKVLAQAVNGKEVTIDGRGPAAGELFRNPGLARTLRAIAEGGKQAYYTGEIAESIVAIIHEAGGVMSVDDLATHTSTWDQPISADYRGLRVWECPPAGQGLVALLAFNILEGFDLAALPPLSAERLHLEIEALKLAFADALLHVADPAFYTLPLEELLSKEYAAQRRTLIRPHEALKDVSTGISRPGNDTVYFCVVDGDGNACSFINSNYMGFGTGIVPRGWGFTLQNRGCNFSLDEQHPNRLEPGKRPYHTIIPALLTHEDGSLYGPFGVMGGFMQPQGHVQTLIALLDDALDPQAALDQPRFCLDVEHNLYDVLLEESLPDATVQELQEYGHPVKLIGGMERSHFGRGQIIRRDPVTGVLCGGSDPRADGCAMGLS
jgi:gamma-glutamyltranspeptidase / glutathione hydrolase